MRNDYDFINEATDNKHILNIFITLLKEIADGIKETNEIRKKEQTELWKEVKDLKISSDKLNDIIFRESEVRPGILQNQQNLYKSVCKLEKIVYGAVSIIAFINMLPVLKEFINLLK